MEPGIPRAVHVNADRFFQAIQRRGKVLHVCLDERSELQWRPLLDETRDFLAQHSIAEPLLGLLQEHSYRGTLTFGQLRFSEVNEIARENAESGEGRCIQEGLLVVGSGPSGDPIVVDLLNGGTVGFVNHDEFWGVEDTDARQAYVPTPFDLGSFYLADALFGYDAAREDQADYGTAMRWFPVDAYAAAQETPPGWESFEEGLLAWESGRYPVPGLSFPRNS